MRKNMSKIKIRALALALGAATIFSVTGPAFGGHGFQVEAATNTEESDRKDWIRQEKKIMKVTYDSIVDGLLIAFPNLNVLGPALKYFAGLFFDQGGDTSNSNAEIMNRLEQLEAEIRRVAFLDIHMRGMNGVELAKELKEVNPKMNIIFVTGFSEYTGDAMRLHASGYIMKPVTAAEVKRELSDLRFPVVPKKDALLRVQCFGNFDVFLPGGEHMHFERSRSKEIFAYLVHKCGSSCTIKEIAAALFEDEMYDQKQLNYMQQLIHSLMKSLRAVGAEATVVKSFNSLAVNPDLLDCDYYRFKELDSGAVNSYENEYMSQYYWADFFI